MNKEQKAAVVEELSVELKDAEAIFAIDYRGISVPQAAELRTGLREADARFRVVKNRLTLLAAEAAGTDGIKEHLTGPTALALVSGDVALAAKTLRRLGDEWELLEFKGGVMEGEPLDPESFVAIAKLPGRDQLNAQFAGIVASPLTGLVRGLGSMVQGLASQLQQIADQGLVTGEAPAPEAPAEEAAPAEESEGEEAADETPEAADETSEEQEPEAQEAGEQESKAEEGGDPDPEPTDSPEEEPSEERAPEGEQGGEQVPQTGEGDAQPGEAADDGADADGEAADEAADDDQTSEDSEQNKEEDQ
jgi:large subunit ribosomal protein L10